MNGQSLKLGNKRGVKFEHPEEIQAFSRWRKFDFSYLEENFARTWRTFIKSSSIEHDQPYLNKYLQNAEQSRSLNDIAVLARKAVKPPNAWKLDYFKYLFNLSSYPQNKQQQAWLKLSNSGKDLTTTLPYISHIAYTDAYFYFASYKGLISKDRFTNKIDFTYYYYAPFAKLFVSSDKLHRRTAEHILRDDQDFIWGMDLKDELSKLNAYYLDLPDKEKEKGIYNFASRPPKDWEGLIGDLWDKYAGDWRHDHPTQADLEHADWSSHVQELSELNKSMSDETVLIEEADSISIERQVRLKRGSWYQMPKGYKA